MIQYTSRLKNEVDAKIEQIEHSEISTMTKSLEASRVLRGAYNQLKTFFLSYNFQSEEEEIMFFKEIKPRLYFRLIYYHKLYNIEMDRPTGIDKRNIELTQWLKEYNKTVTKKVYLGGIDSDFERHEMHLYLRNYLNTVNETYYSTRI